MSVRTRTEFLVPGLHEPISHYTHAVRYGDLLFMSGCTGSGVDSEVVSDDVVEQTRQVFRNMEAILVAAGASFANVLKVTVYLTDINDRPLINTVRQEVFGSARPASTLVEVSRLAHEGAKVEIEAIVALPSSDGSTESGGAR
jgi:2-iminobutanoate/2-iminopropanoate deaminase